MIDPVDLIAIMSAAALFPFLAVVATSFVKLSVVFFLVRHAIGVQNIPPNMALNALAIILSATSWLRWWRRPMTSSRPAIISWTRSRGCALPTRLPASPWSTS